VKAGVDGVIQSISQSDSAGGDGEYDSGSGEDSFITIMETGTYRVKGSANETNIASLSEGMPVIVYSRTNYDTTWSGTISEIDTGSAEQEEGDSDSFASEGGNEESAARYSFYVQLDSSDGMMMGQHVYILPGTRPEGEGIVLNAAFVDKEGENAFVWAASGKDTLEKRSVTLGQYNEASDSYPILDGLTLEDYVAQCSPSLAEGKAVVKYDAESYGQEEGDSSAPGEELEPADGSMMTEEEYMGEGSMDFPEGSAFAPGDYAEDFADDAAIDGEG
jgi:HlyD family secretion protein